MLRKSLLVGVAVVAIGLTAVLAGCQSSTEDALLDAPKSLPKGETAEVKVYYPVGGEMVAETHVVEKSANMPKAALDELFKLKPDNKSVTPILPGAKVIDVKIVNGEAVVNFDKKVLDFKANKEEQTLAVAAIINTLAEFQEIKQVRFEVEGKTQGTIDGQNVEAFWGEVTLKNTWKMPTSSGESQPPEGDFQPNAQ
ncbi:MAG: GerMN domain-containing protein [Candidatus Aquicultorales bacterium]